MTGVVVALLALVLINAIESYRINKIVFRHQKAIEWFAKHVYLDDRVMPKDAPAELADLLHMKEDEPPLMHKP